MLQCADDHQFESWFASSAAYDKLRAAGQVQCAVCGATDVKKTLMAPSVSKEDTVTVRAPSKQEQDALAKWKADVEQNSEHVGSKFAEEARAIHDGTAPERQIHGEAKPEDAKKLIEDGIPVVPLPFVPKGQAN